MNPICIIGMVVIAILAWIEYRYSPRIDVTREGDVLLWYNIKKNYRHFKHLFKRY